MIEHGLWHVPGPPAPVTATDSAALDCGCRVLVGVRTDTTPSEAAVAALPCSIRHRVLMQRFGGALTDSLVNPTSRPLIDVVDELLVAAKGAEGA